ncbi:hypothetical protein H6796_03170 [Candidatus Nomurabacteria bacterium]|nr:hypothetical protein [Candidatus Nomurabacteria bacterium]
MSSRVNVFRAISASVARRIFWVAVTILIIIFSVLLAIMWLLAHFISPWWWIFLIVYIPLFVACALVVLIANFLIKKLYPQKLNKEQKSQLDDFTQKLQRLVETRGMGWPLFALLNFKDLILHRELRTTKHVVSDASSLKKDFADLERNLNL